MPWWQTIRAYAGGAAGVVVILALVMGKQLFTLPSGQVTQPATVLQNMTGATPRSGATFAASSPAQSSPRITRPLQITVAPTPVVGSSAPTTLASMLPRQLVLPQGQPIVAVTKADYTLGTPQSPSLGATVPAEVRRWGALILKYAGPQGLDPNLVAAVMVTESGGNPSVTSSKGAVGLMQVIGGSYDPETNVRQGTQILAGDLQRFNGDLELALSAYNAGAHAVDTYAGMPPYLETENYVFEVLNRYYLYSPAS